MVETLIFALRMIGVKLLTSFASEKFLEWLLFWVAQKIVDSTENQQDNELLNKITEAYKGSK